MEDRVFTNGVGASRIKPNAVIPCKPFKTSHEEQIKLVTDFSFVDFEKLRNLREPFITPIFSTWIASESGSESEKKLDLILKASKPLV